MKTRKLYKWFVWHSSSKKYVAVSGLFPFSRAEYERIFGCMYLPWIGCDLSFSIPFFN